jgi:hypothetical protein
MLMTTESASLFAFPTSIVLPLVITGFLGLFATFLVVYWQQKKSAVPALSVTPEPTTTQKTTVASRKPASNPKQRSLAAEKVSLQSVLPYISSFNNQDPACYRENQECQPSDCLYGTCAIYGSIASLMLSTEYIFSLLVKCTRIYGKCHP